jgi:hypothetical protein
MDADVVQSDCEANENNMLVTVTVLKLWLPSTAHRESADFDPLMQISSWVTRISRIINRP